MQWVEKWMTLHATTLLIAFVLFWLTQNINSIIICAAISFVALFIYNGKHRGSLNFLTEAATFVTTCRLALLLFISATFITIGDAWVGCIAIIIILLDGLDGYLARKHQTSSHFGAYLDMETDALFVFLLSCILYIQGKLGAWILFIGLLRYFYFLSLLFFKPKEQKEKRNYLAQVIAVLLMLSLAGGFLLPSIVYYPVIIVSSILVLFSFGKSFRNVLFA